MLYQEVHTQGTRITAVAVAVAVGASLDADREASRRVLTTPAGVLAIAMIVGGIALVWRDARHEISADAYRGLAAVAARSCQGSAELRGRVSNPIRNSERMGVELHLQELARASVASGAGGAGKSGRDCGA
jgi:hypothetical protein